VVVRDKKILDASLVLFRFCFVLVIVIFLFRFYYVLFFRSFFISLRFHDDKVRNGDDLNGTCFEFFINIF
jgi:hypothetical protein